MIVSQFYSTAQVFICVMSVFTLVVCLDRKLVGFEMLWAGRSWILFNAGLIMVFGSAVIRDVQPLGGRGLTWDFTSFVGMLSVAIISLATVLQLFARSPAHNRFRIVISALGVWLSLSFVVVFL